MAIKFKMVPKQNNLVQPPEIKYYPCAVHDGEVDLQRLAKILSDSSTITIGDCYGVIMNLSLAIADALSEGKIVRLDSLGTFQVTLKGEGADNPDDLGKTSIKGANIVYRPSKNLKKSIKDADFKRIR